MTLCERVRAYGMSMKSFFKHMIALGAAALLPLGYALQRDHYSNATRSRWSWAGLPLDAWQVKEDVQSRWVRDVLNLSPDYFDGVIGGPVWISAHIGALPGKARETKLFMDLWEKASAEEKVLVRIEAVLCLIETDWRVREQVMEEAVKRWQRS